MKAFKAPVEKDNKLHKKKDDPVLAVAGPEIKDAARLKVAQPRSGLQAKAAPVGNEGNVIRQLLTPVGSPVFLDPTGGFRPADWRWQLGLLKGRIARATANWMDPWSRAARKFSKALRACHSEADLLKLKPKFPDEVEAVTLRIQKSPFVRWEVEARILADQSPEVIASIVGMSVGAIEWYERWFFGIRDRLTVRSYVTHNLIRWHALDPAKPEEVLWKAYAYWGGPLILDLVMREMRDPVLPPMADLAEASLTEETCTRLLIRMAILVDLTPVNETNCINYETANESITPGPEGSAGGSSASTSAWVRWLSWLPHMMWHDEPSARPKPPNGNRCFGIWRRRTRSRRTSKRW
ncbi:MAG: hypothetical protein K8T89_05525 [Planctomycetes bacterium]|nr:hypothetical protein [Planctomycetota bacterium]